MKTTMLILFAMLSFGVSAQSCPEAKKLMEQNAYDAAISQYKKCLKENPKDNTIAFSIANLFILQNKHAEALPFLDKALAAAYPQKQVVYFRKALCHAALKNAGAASEQLKLAAESGFLNYPALDSAQFLFMKDSQAFIKNKKAIKYNAFPCLKEENNKKFDFWLGEWDVYTNGQLRARSSISKAKGGCAVHEKYVVLSGVYSGESISFYDDQNQQWEQYWVGSAGDKSKYYEYKGLPKANLAFITKFKNKAGVDTWTRMAYYKVDENTVIQELESSTDKGETWNGAFKGEYRRIQ